MQTPSRKKAWLLLPLLMLGAATVFLLTTDNGQLSPYLFQWRQIADDSFQELRATLLNHGRLAPIVFGTLQILQVIFAPIPGEATGFLGGYVFGAWPGFFYSSIALTIGSGIAFGIGRLLGDTFIRDRFFASTKIYRRFNRLVHRGNFAIPFVLFLLPGFPKDSLSYLLGLSFMPFRVFIFITAVARMPGTLMLSFQGSQLYQQEYLQLLILLLATLAVTLPCYYFRRQILAHLTFYHRRGSN